MGAFPTSTLGTPDRDKSKDFVRRGYLTPAGTWLALRVLKAGPKVS